MANWYFKFCWVSVSKFKLGHTKKNWTQWATIGDDSSLKHILTFEKPYRIKHLFVSDSCTYSVSAKIRNLTYALCAKQVEYDADQVDCQCTAYYWLISVVRNWCIFLSERLEDLFILQICEKESNGYYF